MNKVLLLLDIVFPSILKPRRLYLAYDTEVLCFRFIRKPIIYFRLPDNSRVARVSFKGKVLYEYVRKDV
uniref:Uncharacterized protein n=1 Tax=Palisada sp. TaxID=1955416 RepID=A0A1Z1MSI5_9FLOR|nr:hypothetical protein [Palisada sp.]